jgi:hypothetical protein
MKKWILLLCIVALVFPFTAHASWWDSDYKKCYVITVTGAHNDRHPLDMWLNSSHINFTNSKADGTDFRAVSGSDCDDGGTELNFTMISWNRTDETGRVFVQLPESATTTFLIYINNTDATNASSTDTGLIHFYPLDGNVDDVVGDQDGTFTNANANAAYDSGYYGMGINFSSRDSSNNINIPAEAFRNMPNGSLSFRMYHQSDLTSNQDYIWFRNHSDGVLSRMQGDDGGGSGYIFYWQINNSPANYDLDYELALGNWHKLTFMWNESHHIFYLNESVTWSLSVVDESVPDDTNDPLYFCGTNHGVDPCAQVFDEIAIWNFSYVDDATMTFSASSEESVDIDDCRTLDVDNSQYSFVGNVIAELSGVDACINVTGTNMTIDMAGYKIIGNGSGTGFYAANDDILIMNGYLDNLSIGVDVNESANTTLRNINISNITTSYVLNAEVEESETFIDNLTILEEYGEVTFGIYGELQITSDADLEVSNLNISENRISFDTDSALNTSAEIVLYDISYPSNETIHLLKRDNSAFEFCDDCVLISYANDDINFNITSWSEYSTVHSTEHVESTAYETVPINISLNITSVDIDNSVAILEYDNINYTATRLSGTPTLYQFNASITPELTSTNATNRGLRWYFNLSFYDGVGTEMLNRSNTSQSILWVIYNQSITTSLSSPSVGQNFNITTIYENVSMLVSDLTISSNVTLDGTDYVSNFISHTGNNRTYRRELSAPTSNGSYGHNSTLILTFNGTTVTRLFGSSFSTSIPELLECNATLTEAFNFTFYDEETNTEQINFAEGGNRFEATFSVYDAAGSNVVANYTFNLSNASSYAICLNPSDTSFLSDATIRYYNDSYTTRYYFLERYTVDNVSDSIPLYLLGSTDSSPISFVVYEDDGITGADDVIIYAERYYPDPNEYEIVSMAKTDGDGNAFTYLKMNTVFHRLSLYRDGVQERIFADSLLGGDASIGTSVTLALAEPYLTDWWRIYELTDTSCEDNNETAIVSCSWTDSSGYLDTMTLTAQRYGAMAWAEVCQDSDTGSAGTVSCNVTSDGDGTYYYWLFGNYSLDDLNLKFAEESFSIGIDTRPFGTEGLMLVIIIILLLVMMASSSPATTIVAGIVALIISIAMGALDRNLLMPVIGIIFVGIILAMKVRG